MAIPRVIQLAYVSAIDRHHAKSHEQAYRPGCAVVLSFQDACVLGSRSLHLGALSLERIRSCRWYLWISRGSLWRWRSCVGWLFRTFLRTSISTCIPFLFLDPRSPCQFGLFISLSSVSTTNSRILRILGQRHLGQWATGVSLEW